ncbi:hypothetical protein T03_12218 [Trichinella britovi]|uniref:WAP domain-containing protein n=1 Tax=Trichinella britovi TaxID=45882 RepID=A0A0V1CRN4_TRIBR|nr:hypothetical protein T03_12218 [Trichinella britovi]
MSCSWFVQSRFVSFSCFMHTRFKWYNIRRPAIDPKQAKRFLLPETDFGRCADGLPAESVCNRKEQCGKTSQSCVRGLCCNTAAHNNAKAKRPTDTESSCPRSLHPRLIQFSSGCSMDTDCHFQKKC